MAKKIVFLVVGIVVLILIGGGFFYWWQGHADERELNKTLPKGIRVDKCLLSGEYRVVNKIDGYEFPIPPEWQGIKEIEYIPERIVEDMKVASIGIEGIEGIGRIMSIDVYKVNQLDINLETWAENLLNKFGLSGELIQENISEYNVLSMVEKEHLAGTYIYFLKNNLKIYVLNGASEEFLRYIITYGKW